MTSSRNPGSNSEQGAAAVWTWYWYKPSGLPDPDWWFSQVSLLLLMPVWPFAVTCLVTSASASGCGPAGPGIGSRTVRSDDHYVPFSSLSADLKEEVSANSSPHFLKYLLCFPCHDSPVIPDPSCPAVTTTWTCPRLPAHTFRISPAVYIPAHSHSVIARL